MEYVSKPQTTPSFDLIVKDTEQAFIDIALLRAQKCPSYTVRVVQRLSSYQISWVLVLLSLLSVLSVIIPHFWITLIPCVASLIYKAYTRNSVFIHMVDYRHTQETIPSLWGLVLYWIQSIFRYESVCHGGLYNHHYYLGSRDKIFDI